MQKASLPKLLYGTAWKKEKTATCVEMALECGFRGIDTACQPKHYDDVRAHSIWPPCALALGQLTHEHLARLRIDYVAS